MKYKNIKTGFVFDSQCEIKAEGWVKLDPQPVITEEKKADKPVRTRRTKKDE